MKNPMLLCLLAAGLVGCSSAPPQPGGERASDYHQLGNLLIDGVPVIPAELVQRLQQYQNTRSAHLRGWVGDGLLITTRFGDTSQLHLVQSPLGTRQQITFFNEPVSQAFVPVGIKDGFIYARDTGGSEFYQLFYYDWRHGTSRLLTGGRSRYGDVIWTNAADRFVYSTTERNGRDWDIHLQDADGNRSVLIETDAGAWTAMDFSPDDERLLLRQYLSINESRAFELDIATGALRPLLDASVRTAIGDLRYSDDGEGVYFASDLGAEFMRLHHLDLRSGAVKVLTSDVPWDVEAFDVSPDGRHLAFSINEQGMSRLQVWRLPELRPLALPSLPVGVLSAFAFSGDGGRIALSMDQARAPADTFVLDLEKRALTRWTSSEVGGLDRSALIEPELIEYPTFDEDGGEARRIPAFVYRPAGPGPHPVLISIHGGPEAQYRPGFSATLQYYATELGIAVIVPNVRGSSGYGKSYLKLDNGLRREDSVRDIGALLDWIDQTPDLDAERVAVMGGSYGGYMVLASLVHYGERLAAGIESVGISNFVTFLTKTEAYRRDLRRSEYGDERDPQMRAHLEAISPLNRVERINAPLLIFQGANDPRVPVSESEQIAQALKEGGTPVWYVVALDEGHGFLRKVNRDYQSAATVLFLERFLLR